MTITDAINRFAGTVGREGKDSSDVQVVSVPATLPADFPLTGALAEFYSQLSFTKLTIGGESFFKIFPLSRLKEGQNGWRWITRPPSKELIENSKWDKSWVVFGDRNGDAFFVKSNQKDSPVFGMLQGEEYRLSSSFASFLNIVSDCLVMEQLEYSFDTHGEDFTVHEEFINSTRQIVEKYETVEIAEEYADFFFG